MQLQPDDSCNPITASPLQQPPLDCSPIAASAPIGVAVLARRRPSSRRSATKPSARGFVAVSRRLHGGFVAHETERATGPATGQGAAPRSPVMYSAARSPHRLNESRAGGGPGGAAVRGGSRGTAKRRAHAPRPGKTKSAVGPGGAGRRGTAERGSPLLCPSVPRPPPAPNSPSLPPSLPPSIPPALPPLPPSLPPSLPSPPLPLSAGPAMPSTVGRRPASAPGAGPLCGATCT